MSILSTGWLINTLRPTISHITSQALCPALYVQSRDYAARKGTRARKAAIIKVRKAKNAAALAKLNAAKKEQKILSSAKLKNAMVYRDDSKKQDIPAENVYVARYYKWQVYSFEEAIQCHKETNAPDMFDAMNAYVQILIDLNLQGRKKTKFIEKIDRVAVLPHIFPQNDEKNIIFFTDDENHKKTALDAGADVAGGTDVLRQIQTGAHSLEEHDYFLAHPDILPQLLLLKGIFRSRLPTQLAGTLSSDVAGMVHKFKHGIKYTLQKSTVKEDYGIIKADIGTLDMDVKHLEANYKAFLTDLLQVRPKRQGSFILRTRLCCPPSQECPVVDYNLYINDPYASKTKAVETHEDEEDDRGVIESV